VLSLSNIQYSIGIRELKIITLLVFRYIKKKMPPLIPQEIRLNSYELEENVVLETTKEDKSKKKEKKEKRRKHERIKENDDIRQRSSVSKEEKPFTKEKIETKKEKIAVGSRRSSISKGKQEKHLSSKPVLLDLPKPQKLAKSSSFLSSSEATDQEIKKSSKKKIKRPQTCATVSSSLGALDAELKSSNAGKKDTLHGQIFSDVDSEHFPR